MTPARLAEIVAAMRSPEGCACSPDEMSEAFLLLADRAGIGHEDAELDAIDAMTEMASRSLVMASAEEADAIDAARDGLGAYVPTLAARTRRAEAFGSVAVAQIRNLLASAHPHPKEHPTMTAAWAAARAFLAERVEP